MFRTNLKDAFLADADLTNAYLGNADLTDAFLANSNLIGARLNGIILDKASFTCESLKMLILVIA